MVNHALNQFRPKPAQLHVQRLATTRIFNLACHLDVLFDLIIKHTVHIISFQNSMLSFKTI